MCSDDAEVRSMRTSEAEMSASCIELKKERDVP